MKKKEDLKKRIARCRAAFKKHGYTLELCPNRKVHELVEDMKEVLAEAPYFYVMDKNNDQVAPFQSIKELEDYIDQVPGRNVTIFIPDSPTEETRVTNISVVKKTFEKKN